MIITIDGPAGSGKSSTARAVARELGFRYLDSGAFYRALTYAALRAQIPPGTWDALDRPALDRLGVQAAAAAGEYRLLIGDEDITEQLRSAMVNAHVSLMARVPAVRYWLLEHLRAAAAGGDLVADGRDMGTVVFPTADLKVFLTADLDTRARRRLLESGVPQPDPADIRAEAHRLRERDRIDAGRALAPLRRPHDAVDLDTTALQFEEQVRRIVTLARHIQHPDPG